MLMYSILVAALLIIVFLLWLFLFHLKIPELKLPAKADSAEKVARIDEWFETLQKANKFNGVVLFSNDGNPLLAKGYGYADVNKQRELNKNTPLRLASVSKQFTAAAIMLLKEQRKVDFDDYVVSIIKDLPYKNVTIRQLLNHTSGIPDVYMNLAQKNKKDIQILTNEIAVNLIIKAEKKAINEPNIVYQYSNTNYIILARIIEIISSKSFENFMKSELFEPLEMDNTRVWNLISNIPFDDKADDLDNFNGEFTEIKPSFIDGVAGDGAVFSSALDLLKWDKFWYQNNLISSDIMKEAFKAPTLENGTKSLYGFGWILTPDGVWHNGGWLGAKTFILRNTKTKSCTVILDNSSNPSADKIIKMLISVK